MSLGNTQFSCTRISILINIKVKIRCIINKYYSIVMYRYLKNEKLYRLHLHLDVHNTPFNGTVKCDISHHTQYFHNIKFNIFQYNA